MTDLKELTLLYVEDEIETLNLYLRYFQSNFKMVYSGQNGKDALELYEEFRPNVIILDINIPYINGLEVAREIRKKDKKTKIIMLTAKSDKQTFLQAVELNLTTFLEKPVSRKQLLEAFEKLSPNKLKKILEYKDKYYLWDTYKNELYYDNKKINLTKNEIKLFSLFMNNTNKNFSYQEIYEYVWFEKNNTYSEAAIKTLIKGLRVKLPPDIIKNIYGIGYFINLPKAVTPMA